MSSKSKRAARAIPMERSSKLGTTAATHGSGGGSPGIGTETDSRAQAQQGAHQRLRANRQKSRAAGAAESAGAHQKTTEATGHDSVFPDQTDQQRHAGTGSGNARRTPGASRALTQDRRSFVTVEEWTAKADSKKGAPVTWEGSRLSGTRDFHTMIIWLH